MFLKEKEISFRMSDARINRRHYRQKNNFETFRERVKACVKESVSQVFNPPTMDDPHYITFGPYVKEIHDPIKLEIYDPKVNKYLSVLFIMIKCIKFTDIINLSCFAGRRRRRK